MGKRCGVNNDPINLLLYASLESLGVIINDFVKQHTEDGRKIIYASICENVSMDGFENDTQKIIDRIKFYVPEMDLEFKDLSIEGYDPNNFIRAVKKIVEFIYGPSTIRYTIRNDYIWNHDNAEEIYNGYISKLDLVKSNSFLTI